MRILYQHKRVQDLSMTAVGARMEVEHVEENILGDDADVIEVIQVPLDEDDPLRTWLLWRRRE